MKGITKYILEVLGIVFVSSSYPIFISSESAGRIIFILGAIMLFVVRHSEFFKERRHKQGGGHE